MSDQLMRKAIPTGEARSRAPWDLWMWRRPSSPTTLYHCNHRPEAKITMRFQKQAEKGRKKNATIKNKTRGRKTEKRDQEVLTIWCRRARFRRKRRRTRAPPAPSPDLRCSAPAPSAPPAFPSPAGESSPTAETRQVHHRHDPPKSPAQAADVAWQEN